MTYDMQRDIKNLKEMVHDKMKEKYVACDNTVTIIKEKCDLKITEIDSLAQDLTCRLTGRVEDCEQLIDSRVTQDYVETFGQNLKQHLEEMLNRKLNEWSGQLEQANDERKKN